MPKIGDTDSDSEGSSEIDILNVGQTMESLLYETIHAVAILAGYSNALSLQMDFNPDVEKLPRIKNAIACLAENNDIVKPLRDSIIRFEMMMYDGKKKKSGNSSGTTLSSVSIKRPKITSSRNKLKAIGCILPQMTEYARSFNEKAHYFALIGASDDGRKRLRTLRHDAKYCIERLEIIRHVIKC